jgi:hypothetical protein
MDDENKKDKAALKALQKEQTQKNEENRQLREKVANLEAQLEGNNNDLNYDSSDNDNDINYDSEPSGHEEKRQ